ncbi:saccharopine dehydrogenase NADP-binding domain-containing protein [Dyadobacter fermentans]|uniref:saccharopine dehydrogenase NADP-binding domain-containing protein n=1 Tax=Dyadobacter fermentans TaxID=94254 RepID=UPI001CBFEE43|nr:saccharopine dehydrogenase NADP-binding domain-containing protein [Dyadobacter fermentans]MBZ1357184.1 saccharopine dehydrogenase NADP-binding domain-containing protein [Dyadobacter fermentans]
MNKVCIVVTGAGELGKAVGLLLTQFSPIEATYFIADKNPETARLAAQWICEHNTKGRSIYPYHFDASRVGTTGHNLLRTADLIIDCLPSIFAPQVARLARRHNSHYVNSTACLPEIEEIQEIALDSGIAFVLQAGIAPGLINLLLRDLFHYYRDLSNCSGVDYAGVRTALLPSTETGSRDAVSQCSFLSCREAILISNIKQHVGFCPSIWESNELSSRHVDASIMAGGNGNLVDALANRVRQSGHPIQLRTTCRSKLQGDEKNQDRLVAQAIIEGYTEQGRPITLLKSCHVYPAQIGRCCMPALQLARAVLLLESARLVIHTEARGLVFTNQLDPLLLLQSKLVQQFFLIEQKPEIICHQSES